CLWRWALNLGHAMLSGLSTAVEQWNRRSVVKRLYVSLLTDRPCGRCHAQAETVVHIVTANPTGTEAAVLLVTHEHLKANRAVIGWQLLVFLGRPYPARHVTPVWTRRARIT